MNRKNKKKLLIGRRTGVDVIGNKMIRIENGIENYDDYWTSFEGDASNICTSPKVQISSSPVGSKIPRVSSFFKNIEENDVHRKTGFVNTYQIPSTAKETSLESKDSDTLRLLNAKKSFPFDKIVKRRTLLNKGIRTGLNLVAGKEIKIDNGMEDYEDYWTDTPTINSNEYSTVDKLSKTHLFSNKSSNKAITGDKHIATEEQRKSFNNGYPTRLEVDCQPSTSSNKTKKLKKRLHPTKNSDENQTKEQQLRRSKRKRIPPLETWRNEYQRIVVRSGIISEVIVEKGTKADTAAIDAIMKKMNRNSSKSTKVKKQKLQNNTFNRKEIQNIISRTAVVNPYTGEEELVHLHRPFNTLLWSVPNSHDQSEPPYQITKCISGDMITFGFIDILPLKNKELQYSPEDNITFNVIKGKVEIKINKDFMKLNELDTVTVPASNSYTIRNTGKLNALLYFCTFKSPLFAFQCDENASSEVD